MAFSMAGGGPSRPEINVTPLIDVLLVLIIVFMVIVATTKEYKVDALLPQPGKPEQPHQNERTIVIQILWSAQSQFPCSKSIRNPYLGSNWNRTWNESSWVERRRSCTSKGMKVWTLNMWHRSWPKLTTRASNGSHC